MKLNQTASKITLSALLVSGLSLGGLVAGTKGEVAERLDNVSRLELPAEAVAIMKGAPRNVRLAKAIEVVRAAAEIAPHSLATVVKAISKAEPSLAADVALVAAQSLSDSAREKSIRYISSSAITAAPTQTQKIVANLAKAFPEQADQIFLGSTYKRSSEVVGMGVLGLRDADPNIFGVESAKVAEGLSAEQVEILTNALYSLLGVDAQLATLNINIVSLSLNTVNAIVNTISSSTVGGSTTQQSFTALIQTVIAAADKVATDNPGASVADILTEALTETVKADTGSDVVPAETLTELQTFVAEEENKADSEINVAKNNTDAVVELVTVTVDINPTDSRSYSASAAAGN